MYEGKSLKEQEIPIYGQTYFHFLFEKDKSRTGQGIEDKKITI
jgi:hypothetical protein